MAIAVEMPKMSDTMEEGVLVSWEAEEGDEVSAGDVIAQVETDKATMDLEVYDDGVLLKRVIGVGDAVPIGGLIAVLGEKGEDPSEILAQYEGGDGAAETAKPEEDDRPEGEAEPAAEGDGKAAEAAGEAVPEKAEKKREKTAEKKREEAPQRAPGGDGAQKPVPAPAAAGDGDARLKSSPLARRIAQEHGINLRAVQGSGPEGRIIKRDVQAAIEEGVAEPEVAAPDVAPAPAFEVAAEEHVESEGVSQMRKTIARRLAESKYTAPHFYLTVDVDMKKAAASRTEINEVAEAQNLPRVSFNDLITKACAMALRHHPNVNASYLEKEGEIRRYKHVHVAIAVAIDEGLVTPVIRHADLKGLSQIAAETRELAGRARERKLQPPDWEGSTFTTSNLGMFGIEEFTAIINPPNSCILAIGAVRDVPVVENGEVVPGKRMKLTLSCDHRLVDGATGAEFLGTVQQYLEEPLTMLL